MPKATKKSLTTRKRPVLRELDTKQKASKRTATKDTKLSHKEFILNAIVTLRKLPYKGIHTVYSGFNSAFKAYFDGADPIKATTKLAEDGDIVVRPVKGGVTIYLPEDMSDIKDAASEALKKMGL